MQSGMAEYTLNFFMQDRLLFGLGINVYFFLFYAINSGLERFYYVLSLTFPLQSLTPLTALLPLPTVLNE